MPANAFEPGDDTCPPYWSELVWWLIHHHHGDPGPIDEIAQLDEIYAVLAVRALAGRIADDQVAAGVSAAVAGHSALASLR